jgi:DNA-binding HxlR family transcriptional regulator
MAQRLKKSVEANSHHDCEFREMLSRVGDKWSLLVICILKDRPALRGRFSDLKRSIPGISQRMLTATVRSLERDGMLTRHVYAEVPPRVEYELTPLGRALMDPVMGLVSWLQSNWPVIRSARDRFDARKQAALARRAEAPSLDVPRVTRLGMRPPAEERTQLASVRKP